MEHFRVKTRDGVKVIEAAPLAEAGFAAAFSTRLGGVSPLPDNALNLGHFSGDNSDNVTENRRRFLATLELDGHPARPEIVTAKQVHSADSHCVISLEQARTQTATCDALLTNNPSVLLGIQTADCLPVLIVDRKTRAVAGVHAGWRGTLARIVERSIQHMTAQFGSNPADCLAATGPAIGECCFEIGPEVREAFVKEFAYGEALFSKHQENGKSHMDLRAANRNQLIDSGLHAENIFVLPDCTRCRMDNYFSYRGEIATGKVGRLLSIVGLV